MMNDILYDEGRESQNEKVRELENQLAAVTAERDQLQEVVLDCREEFEYISDRGGIPLWVYSACKVRIKAIDAAKGGAR